MFDFFLQMHGSMGRISREAAGQCVDSARLQGILWPECHRAWLAWAKMYFHKCQEYCQVVLGDEPFMERHAAHLQLLCSGVVLRGLSSASAAGGLTRMQ